LIYLFLSIDCISFFVKKKIPKNQNQKKNEKNEKNENEFTVRSAKSRKGDKDKLKWKSGIASLTVITF